MKNKLVAALLVLVALTLATSRTLRGQGVAPGADRIVGIPDPAEMMRITDPFKVPDGRLFVVTGIGREDLETEWRPHSWKIHRGAQSSLIHVRMDDELVLSAQFQSASAGRSPVPEDVVAVPPGLVAVAGQTISAEMELYTETWGTYGGRQPATTTRPVVLGYLHDPAAGGLRIRGIPDPLSMRRVTESAPLTVPDGSVFVVTALVRAGAMHSYVEIWNNRVEVATSSVVRAVFDGEVALSALLGDGVVPSQYSWGKRCDEDYSCLPEVAIDHPGVVATSLLSVPAGLVAPGGSILSVAERSFHNAGLNGCKYTTLKGPFELVPTPDVEGVVLGYLARL